jgi:hypothetical protein
MTARPSATKASGSFPANHHRTASANPAKGGFRLSAVPENSPSTMRNHVRQAA